ncbi:hypothetical protein AUK18_00265 [Candidatus Beckwithbacteria bacterium CG2_30_44_31]|uniref:Antitoxin n=1 Tax=Candidatus Beckwithbacteria bacterium CG2_30_44_31 TaxID=1805035 RepID=A0A1J5BBT4_9BACT|nr:MAG: hypothetical protein AUK18_00265 [Candidatus Beckwithbacteria bacterium CG2_30_44_31]
MNQLVSATFARNNFSDLLNLVVAEKKTVILLRKSQPQAAIVPYEEIEAREKNWQKEFNKLFSGAKTKFRQYLKANNIPAKGLTEEKVYEIINQAAGRY